MNRSLFRLLAVGLIVLFLAVGTTMAVMALVPEAGSPPSIFDDFKWSSTSSGFWHVNAVGASASIKNSFLTLKGDSIELDHRIQTDPHVMVVAAKVRGIDFHKFGLGIGVFHAGTIGMEFDDDGVKCGRGSDYGWKVDYVKGWTVQPTNQWFYLELAVTNPYPVTFDTSNIPKKKLKHVTVRCALFDASGNLINEVTAKNPPPNANYAALDEAFVRTWDSGNQYQVDWFYAGPPSGDPLNGVAHGGLVG
jgi:hypothetical protein